MIELYQRYISRNTELYQGYILRNTESCIWDTDLRIEFYQGNALENTEGVASKLIQT